MKNNPFEMCLLFDFYGDILTEKQQQLFDLYYNEDLSLAEIAEHVGITRQGVRDGIVRAEHILTETEQKLGLVARYGAIESHLKNLQQDITQMQALNQKQYHIQDLDILLTRMQVNLQEMQSCKSLLTNGEHYGI